MTILPAISYSDTFLQNKRQQLINNQIIARQFELNGQSVWSLVTNTAYDTAVNPAITIVLTNYNYARYITLALDSVCNSNLSSLAGGVEILIIDDASQDNSVQKVEEYLQSASFPIALVKNTLNRGTAEIRNLGLKLARASYIFILDADNYIYPNCLETLYKNLTNSNSVAAYSIINKFDDKTHEGCGLLSQYPWDVWQLIRHPYIDAMALFDKKVLLELGGYPTDLIQYGWLGWEDYYIWLKLAQNNYSVKFVPEILSAYRLHSDSQTDELRDNLDLLITHFENQFVDLIRQQPEANLRFGIPVAYEGYLDTVQGEMVSGWAYNKAHFTIPTRIDFFCDGKLVGSTLANHVRSDLFEKKIGTGYHRFVFQLPILLKDGNPHQLAARFTGSNTHLKGSPLTILYQM